MFKFLLCGQDYEWDWYVQKDATLPGVMVFTYEIKEVAHSRKYTDIQYINTHGEYYERNVVVRYEPTWEDWCAAGQDHKKEENELGDFLFSRVVKESGWVKSFDTWEQVQAFIKEHDVLAIVPTEYTFDDGSPVFGLVL